MLLASVAPCATVEDETPLGAVVEWLEEAGARSMEPAEVRQILGKLERRLIQAGIDPSLARALATAPVAGVDEDPQGAVRHTLSRLRRFAASCARPGPAEREEAENVLDEVLADPVFDRTPREANALQRALHRMGEWFQRWFGVAGNIAAANWRLAMALMIVLLLLIVVMVVRQFAAWSRQARFSPSSGSVNLMGAPAPDLPDLVSAARSFAAAGRGLEALRLLVRASVEALRARALLPEEPGLTDLEGVRILGRTAAGPVHASFRELVQFHDRSVYGGAGVGSEVVERAIELTDVIVRGGAEVTP